QRSLRRNIGVVLQDALLFNETVRDNLAYGRPGASQAELEAAARAAQAEELIARLPDGWDTLVGERGCRLSAGERQRLAIARAGQRSAAGDPRRGDRGARRRDGVAGAAGARAADRGAHHLHHRAPP